jgi:ketosteroid isomerase-like protein
MCQIISLKKRPLIMKNQMILVFTVPLFMILFACSTDSTELACKYAQVYNTHHVENIVALYANDAVFEVVGQFSLSGEDQVRNITKYDSVLNIQMSIDNLETSGDTVFCDLTETNDWLKTAGIGQAKYEVMFVFDKGLIKYLQAKSKPETEHDFAQVLSPMMTWAIEQDLPVLKELMPEGKFVYNAENARKTLNLLRLWNESLTTQE